MRLKCSMNIPTIETNPSERQKKLKQVLKKTVFQKCTKDPILTLPQETMPSTITLPMYSTSPSADLPPSRAPDGILPALAPTQVIVTAPGLPRT